jgi:hypothetical protein
MNRRCAIAALTVVALICAPSAAVAGSTTALPEAPALYSQVAEFNQVAELLGRGSGPLDHRREPSYTVLRFENHDGYVISVVASRQTVALRVARSYGRGRRSGRALSTTYLAHGKATANSIKADFGARGQIALRFRPAAGSLRASKRAGCRRAGSFPIARRGFFVGELRFRGEGGYTSAQVHRVRGGSFNLAALLACLLGSGPAGRDALLPSATLPIDLRPFGIGAHRLGSGASAPGVQTHPSDRPKRTVLVSSYKLPVSRTIFAAQTRGSGQARFLAFEAGSEGSIGIARLALASATKSTFTSDDSLSEAAVSPPAPFAGKAVFEHGPGETKSWTGSLAVSFLGEPHLPLVGSPFETQLVRSW